MLKNSLWSGSTLNRSTELLHPLFIERYNGPRNCTEFGSHSFWEFSVVLNGPGLLYLEDRTLPMTDNMLILVPPHCTHRESSLSMSTIWIGFESQIMETVDSQQPIVVCDPALTNSAKKLWLFAQRRFGNIGFEIDGMLMALIGGFFRTYIEGNTASASNPIDKAITWLHEHFSEEICFADVASLAGISEGYFYRLFKKHTGKTPTEYLATIRIEQAARALRMSDTKIADIALAVGYEDQFYFSRVFKKMTGKSPAAFRNCS
ncbi:MAG: AraC family transcriptional regulator [Kiritimatiellales bacterium]|jgi:AraC-like DNA-binding protein